MRAPFITALLAALICQARGNSAGANSRACTSLRPGHGTAQSPSPFSVSASASAYDFTNPTPLTITLSSTGGNTFKGFLIQARSTNASRDQTIAHGDFTAVANTQQQCSNTTGSALTHTSASLKSSLTFTWLPKANSNPGDIEFLVTFVLNYNNYYYRISSGKISETSGAVPTAPTGSATASQGVSIPASTISPASYDADDCGDSQGCFRTPSGCDNGCTNFVSWKRNSGNIEFVISAVSDGYVALGLSSDDKMGDDGVIACILETGGGIKLQIGENVGKSYSATGAASPQLTGASYMGGRLTCSFSMPETASLPGNKALNERWNLLIARANTKDFVSRHDLSGPGFPVFTDKQVSLLETEDVGRGSASKLVKAHGALMCIAWILCTSLGVILARYYKPMWPNTRPGGAALWFQLHRGLMVTNLLLTCTAFIIIFVEAGGYSKGLKNLPGAAHPVLGIIVTALVIINPIMALFRCAPDDAKRPYFNWAHWGVGTTAHILAIATVSIGLTFVPGATSQEGLEYVLYGWIAFEILFVIIMEIFECRNKRPMGEQDFEMKARNGPETEPQTSSQGHQCKCGMLVLYIFVTGGVALSLVICIIVF